MNTLSVLHMAPEKCLQHTTIEYVYSAMHAEAHRLYTMTMDIWTVKASYFTYTIYFVFGLNPLSLSSIIIIHNFYRLMNRS